VANNFHNLIKQNLGPIPQTEKSSDIPSNIAENIAEIPKNISGKATNRD
jgi:hypothetical protein